jgi:hypothetical protein
LKRSKIVKSFITVDNSPTDIVCRRVKKIPFENSTYSTYSITNCSDFIIDRMSFTLFRTTQTQTYEALKLNLSFKNYVTFT